MIKITIIIATYNSSKTLEQAIFSVIEQTYPQIELIIIDGKSTDDTLAIVKKYESFGIRWISEPDDGIYDALNKGIDMATGDYFMILGSDDSLYNSNTISDVVNCIDDDTDILSASVIVVDELSCKSTCAYNHHALDKEIYSGGMIPHQGMFVRTSLGEKYKFDTKYKIAADYKFFLQCYYNKEIIFKYIDEPVAFFSNDGASANVIELYAENNIIYKELNLPFYDTVIDSKYKVGKYLKLILYKMNLLLLALDIKKRIDIVLFGKRHRCSNKVCRWCCR